MPLRLQMNYEKLKELSYLHKHKLIQNENLINYESKHKKS